MPGRYSAVGVGAVSASNNPTVLALTGNTTHRIRLYDFMFGSSATPDDNAIHNFIARFTSPPTSSGSVTPQALDPADPSSLTACVQAATTGTWTAGAVLLRVPTNQRASHRWVAAPEGELVTPATANNGIGYQAVHASHTGDMGATMHWVE